MIAPALNFVLQIWFCIYILVFWGYDTVYSGKWCTDISDYTAWNHRRTYSKSESHENLLSQFYIV
jgi:hypothetical protein